MTRRFKCARSRFNPDEALPKTFDIDRVEVLRGPQGTLFGSGSEGGTVRYITTQPSLTKSSIYARAETSYTQGGEPSYEAGVAGGMPIIDGTLGVRASVWYRRDGGYIDRIDPVTLATDEKNANYDQTMLLRLAAVWAPTEHLTVTPSIYYQDRYRNDVESYWPLYSNPSKDRYVNADPTQRSDPDRFYLTALKVEADLGATKLISNTSYYHRQEETGYDGTLYNLGFYQTFSVRASPCWTLCCSTTTVYTCPRARRITDRRPRSKTTSRTSPRKSACSRTIRQPGSSGPRECSSASTGNAIWSRFMIRC